MDEITSGAEDMDSNVSTATAEDPLTHYRLSGGITHAEFRAAPKVRLANNVEVSELAMLAAGTHNEAGIEIAQGVREMHAEAIDRAVREHAAWLDSRPIIEQVSGHVAPVINIGPAEQNAA